MAPKDSPLSLANLSVFLKPRDNDYPLEVGTVVLSDLTTSKVVELTLKLELVLYERDIVEGESLLDTQQGMISAVEKLYLDPSPGAPAGLIFGTAAFADQTLQPNLLARSKSSGISFVNETEYLITPGGFLSSSSSFAFLSSDW